MKGDPGEPGASITLTNIPPGEFNCPSGGVELSTPTNTVRLCSQAAAHDPNATGGAINNPAASCSALKAAGAPSGVYYVTNPASADPSKTGQAVQVYCEQDALGGGWAMVYNSVLGINTMDFWFIGYLQRLNRKGTPDINSNFYDGALYQAANAEYLDLITDLHDFTVVALHASSTGINPATMRFTLPQMLSPSNAGTLSVFQQQFAAGWSSVDFDGDDVGSSNCATDYNGVAQHYANCWNYSLGSDASSGDLADGRVGPHAYSTTLTQLGLFNDGSLYSRVKRITRFVRW